MTSGKQPKSLLECLHDNFLGQKIDSPAQRDAVLDLMVTNTAELSSNVETGDSLTCSDHMLVEFSS